MERLEAILALTKTLSENYSLGTELTEWWMHDETHVTVTENDIISNERATLDISTGSEVAAGGMDAKTL